MIIAQGKLADLTAIMELEAAGFEVGEQWSVQSWTQELETRGHCVLTRLDPDARVVGAAAFNQVAGTADLLRVVVHPEARGQGIGGSLLRAGMEWAAALGAQQMLLEVRPDNEAALRLYQRHGFAPVTTRRDYYGPDRHALVMLAELDPEVMTA